MNLIDDIVIYEIMSRLSKKSLLSLCSVNKDFHTRCKDDMLWRKLLYYRYKTIIPRSETISYKDLYLHYIVNEDSVFDISYNVIVKELEEIRFTHRNIQLQPYTIILSKKYQLFPINDDEIFWGHSKEELILNNFHSGLLKSLVKHLLITNRKYLVKSNELIDHLRRTIKPNICPTGDIAPTGPIGNVSPNVFPAFCIFAVATYIIIKGYEYK
jgi:hypothetical protein